MRTRLKIPTNVQKTWRKFSGKFTPPEHYIYDHKYPTGGGHVKLSRAQLCAYISTRQRRQLIAPQIVKIRENIKKKTKSQPQLLYTTK